MGRPESLTGYQTESHLENKPGSPPEKQRIETMNTLTQFKKTPILTLLIAFALAVGTALTAVPALATPPSGVTTEFIAGTAITGGGISFDEIDVATKTGEWKARIDTKGASQLYVVRNTFQVGGHTGWHTHPGPSLISVTSGTITVYDGDDPSCTPHVYPAGTGFVDPGGAHVHLLRNEGAVPAVTVATQLLPPGADRRIDAPAPGNCPF
jgi:quercetin dioxygenase-like cupin family protein